MQLESGANAGEYHALMDCWISLVVIMKSLEAISTLILTVKLLYTSPCSSPFSILDTNEHFPCKAGSLPTQLLDNKSCSKSLSRRIIRILKVLSIDTKPMRRITDSIALITLANNLKSLDLMLTYKDANIKRARDPVLGNTPSPKSLKPINILRRRSPIVINIARQPALMQRITNQKNSLDGIPSTPRQLRQRIHSRRSALGVTLQNEAFAGVGRQDTLHLTDDVLCSLRRVLVVAGKVHGVVDLAAGDLGCDLGVHGAEASRGTLHFAGAAGVDYGVGCALCSSWVGSSGCAACEGEEGDEL